MKCLIVAGGATDSDELIKSEVSKANYIICADSGYDKLSRLNIKPDLLLGDFDSINDFKSVSKDVEILKFDVRKNFTDSELAVIEAVKRNPTEVTILAGIGTRLDHSISNVFLLEKLFREGIKGKIINNYNEIIYLEGKMIIDNNGYKYISIIPLDKEGMQISTVGMAYELYDERIDFSSTRGISNEILGKEAEIILHSGRALVIKSHD